MRLWASSEDFKRLLEFYNQVPKPCVIIGDNCYIGTGTTILGPVTIGSNVTIGANSLVVKDVPDNCVVGGNPAKVLKYKE